MSRSSFGQPPQPQVGMAGPKAVGLGPMSAPKVAPQMPAPQAAPMGGPPPGVGASIAGQIQPPHPSLFRRPRY